MKVSEKRKQEAYNALNEAIIDLRLDLAKYEYTKYEIDGKLFNLEQDIWKRLCGALNIEGL